MPNIFQDIVDMYVKLGMSEEFGIKMAKERTKKKEVSGPHYSVGE